MTDKVQLIKEEIERLKVYPQSRGFIKHMIAFIDSLPEEPASEDLKEEVERWIKEKHFIFTEIDEIIETAHHFAEWQKQQMKETLQTEYEKGRFDMKEEMMKDAVEGIVGGHTDIPAFINLEIEHKPNVKVGDKVKIIVLKTE